MISRIYVMLKVRDSRQKLYQKSWKELGLKGKINGIHILDSYTIKHEFSHADLEKVANLLTNPVLEKFSINTFPKDRLLGKFTYAIEIGFLPGVTDNVAHTVKAGIIDLLRLENNNNLEVYTGKNFLISGSIKSNDAKKIASSLYNPLIESSHIVNFAEAKENFNKKILVRIPEVILEKRAPVIKIPLQLNDKELIKIGQEGILDPNGSRRGPLALDLSSMKAIQKYFAELKREPTDIELESLAQTWSEHCKHTIFASPIDNIKDGLYKTYIKGATKEIRKRKQKKGKAKDFCVSVFSDNSGGIIFDKEYLITHKVETHNAPSALDPFGGAITGIVGVNRDAIGFGLGAKPVANTYGFCFGQPEDKKFLYLDKEKKQEIFLPKRIMEGVIKGINVGGNTSGIPTISGFVKFDDRFKGRPLVFAGTVGLIPRNLPASGGNRPSYIKSAQNGDYIVTVGGRVGRDGIHGATFSSVGMNDNSPVSAVQIGDPITQKKMSDAIVKEARGMDLYNSITDNGAGGFSSSIMEMARDMQSRRGGAMIYLEKVPLKYPGLRPWEIWISESQERMTLSVPKKKWEVFHKLMQSRGVEASVIGEFTDSGKCVISFENKIVMDISLEFLHDGKPLRHLETKKVAKTFAEPKLPEGISRTKIFEKLLSDKNIGGFAFVSEQYDHEVQASSVLKPLSGRGRINTDAQVFQPVLSSSKGVVLASGVYPSYGDISAYHMMACALDTAIRNAICAGGSLSHLAILDNFCWCSSNDKTRLGELEEAVKAGYKYAVGYGTPFISGKDSMFNDFQGYDEKGKPIKISIPPTVLISAIGVMEDLNKTVSPEFKNAEDFIYLLGETNEELGASEYYKMLAKKTNSIGNNVPKVNLKKNIKVYQVLEKCIEGELLASALSITSGGLAIALAKACVGGNVGCKVSIENLPSNIHGGLASVDAKLFSESQGRILISVSPKKIKKFEKIIKKIPHTKLGATEKNGKFIIIDDNKQIINSNVKKMTKIYHNFSNSMS